MFHFTIAPARSAYRQFHDSKYMNVAMNEDEAEDEEATRLQRARQKSLENARHSRFDRASTAPPC
jgi:hypothetical protein